MQFNNPICLLATLWSLTLGGSVLAQTAFKNVINPTPIFAIDEAIPSTPPVVGTWEWFLDAGPAGGKASMVVEWAGGKLKATVTAPDGTVLESKDIALQKDIVSFSITREMGVMKMVMSHKGKLDGDDITGSFNMQGGPMKKSGKWHAKRVTTKK